MPNSPTDISDVNGIVVDFGMPKKLKCLSQMTVHCPENQPGRCIDSWALSLNGKKPISDKPANETRVLT